MSAMFLVIRVQMFFLEFLGGSGVSQRRKQRNDGKWNDANVVESWELCFEQRTRQMKERKNIGKENCN